MLPSQRRLIWLLAVLLAVGTVTLYLPSIRNGFINFDDQEYVTANQRVLEGIRGANLVWAFGTDNPASNWHPLTWISHMLDVQLYGTKPAGHHFTNVVFYTLNVVLLFLLLVQGTGRVYCSAAAAALYAVHPLNVESVAWVAERKAVLSVFFMMLMLWAYGWYVRKPTVARYLSVAFLFALALMSKIMVVALPFGLLLLDYWPLQRFSRTQNQDDSRSFFRSFGILFIEKIPFLLLAAGAAAMTLFMHHKTGALDAGMPLAWRINNVLYSYVVYIGKAIWPARLAVFYPHVENSLPRWEAITFALLLAAITGIVWRFRDRRYLLVGWLWFLGTMFPMSGIVQSGRQGMADRYMYIPMIGLIVAGVWLSADWVQSKQWNRGLLVAAFLIVFLPFTYMTHVQIGYWKNSYTLFTRALQVTTNNGVAENNLGSALMEMGQPQLAEVNFQAAVRLTPELASPHYNLGVVLQIQNRLPEAAAQYQQAIALAKDPLELTKAHTNLGIIYSEFHKYPEALTELNAALALDPNHFNSYMGRGKIELQSLNLDAAVSDFSRAAQVQPSPAAYFWLGRALETKGDLPRAKRAYTVALQMAPGLTEAQTRLEALSKKTAP